MKHLGTALDALISTAAAAGACATMWLIAQATGGGGGPAILTTVIALSLGRRTFAGRAEFARWMALLPAIGLGAAAIGWLLVAIPVLGALLYIAGMSVPIWLRRYGEHASRLSALIALPLTAILVVPVAPAAGEPWWLSLLLVLLAGPVAALWVALARELRPPRGTLLSLSGRKSDNNAPLATAAKSGKRLPASTRMAVHMAVGLSAAFLTGWLLFPDHAMWVVLTAFIVNAGNRGRGDVLHKSVLRVLGALGGTVVAVLLALVAPTASGFAAVAAIFAALFAGTWLRSYSYAFWALTVTLVLSLLQQLTGVTPLTGEAGLLAERVLAIVVGAVLGVGAAWFVLPVASTDVLRKRLSEMLVALGAVFGPEPEERAARVAAFRASVSRVEELAPAHRARRLLGGRKTQPIDCIEAASTLPTAVDSRLAAVRRQRADPGDRERLQASIRSARQSLAVPVDLEQVRSALSALAAVLEGRSVA